MPKDMYTKFYRFKAVYPSTITELDSSGYGTITPSIVGGVITLASSAEFSSECWLDDNQNSTAKWIDASTIKFYPIDNWGTLVGEIVEK